jgi:hypothetical protein
MPILESPRALRNPEHHPAHTGLDALSQGLRLPISNARTKLANAIALSTLQANRLARPINRVCVKVLRRDLARRGPHNIAPRVRAGVSGQSAKV